MDKTTSIIDTIDTKFNAINIICTLENIDCLCDDTSKEIKLLKVKFNISDKDIQEAKDKEKKLLDDIINDNKLNANSKK